MTRTSESGRSHVLTISLEEYFHGGALARVVMSKHWDRFESRIDKSVDEALSLLARHDAHATFFVLGVLADRNPDIVQRIVDAGHEVASRGYWPRGPRDTNADEFAEDLDRTAAAIEAAGGGRVRGYRSPRWIGREDLWILEVLAKKGYVYDASVNPVGWQFSRDAKLHTLGRHDLGDLPNLTGSLGSIVEVPVSTVSVGGFRLAIAGGNWMRQLPHRWLSKAVARWDRGRPDPLVFYLTSWELDPEQPQITAASRWNSVRQYRNLWRTRWCLEQYLDSYRLVSIAEHLGLPVHQPAGRAVSALVERPVPVAVGQAGHPGAELPSAGEGDPTADEPTASEVQTISLVVPMHNEEENIPYLLRTLETVAQRADGRFAFELVLVDDCSSDRTWQVLQRLCGERNDVKLMRHDRNLGVAAAIMTGIRGASHDIVCSIDCDCSYDPMDLQEMVPLLADADMVTASPYHPRGQVINVPRWRLFLSRGLSWIYRRVLGTSVHTWTSCFRVCRRDKFLDMQMQHGGFLGVAEMLVRLLRRGGRVREYPTILESRLLGASKMKTIRTIRGHLGLLWQVVRGKIC